MLILYGIKNCDAIKKSINWLAKNEVNFKFHDYKKDGIGTELAAEFIKQFGIEATINRRGTTWRNLSPAEKDNLDEVAAINLMMKYPSLIKRPIIQQNDDWLIGFDSQEFQSLL